MMSSSAPIRLSASTGRPIVDAFLQAAIRAFEAALPEAVRGYYLIGSYADGSAVAISDLDLVVLFKGSLTERASHTAWRVGDSLEASCPVRLDLTISGEHDPTWEKGYVKHASLLIHGDDVRAQLAPPASRRLRPTLADPSRATFRYAARSLRELRGVRRLHYPLSYPDPAGEFYGYDVIRHRDWYPADTTRGLRELVYAVTLMAGALTPSGPGGGAWTKAQVVSHYRDAVGGEWPDYVAALYRDAKLRWGYLVPTAPDERARLRALCQRTLGFENHFLWRFRDRTR